MYSAAIQTQIDEHVRRAKIDRRPVPPLFLVFDDGDYVPAGRVLAATGDVTVIGGAKCVCLLLPVDEARCAVHPDSITGDGHFVRIAQSANGCVPVNGAALEMSTSLR